MSNIISLDLGIRNLGICIGDSKTVNLIHSETFNTRANEELKESLGKIDLHLVDLINKFDITTLVYENPISNKFSNNYGLSHLRNIEGIVNLLAYQYELKVFSYYPSEIKKFITNNSKASKQDIISKVKEHFPELVNKDKFADHEADAISIYLHYLHKNNRLINFKEKLVAT